MAATPASQSLRINADGLITGKLAFTQTDGNEYIDSLADGYLDLAATTGIRLTSPLTRVTGDLYIGNNADSDPAIVFDGDTHDGSIGYDEDNQIVYKTATGDKDINLGLKEWIRSDEGKAFVPPKGALGSGERTFGNAGGKSQAVPSRQEVGAMLEEALLGGGFSGGGE